MTKLLPVLLGSLGLVAGSVSGYLMRVADAPAATHEASTGDGAEAAPTGKDADADVISPAALEVVEIEDQFLVPLTDGDRVVALVVLSLGLEVVDGHGAQVIAQEPRLRAAFLNTLFQHANMGGFSGSITDSETLSTLRKALVETAQATIGPEVADVLLMGLVRNDRD